MDSHVEACLLEAMGYEEDIEPAFELIVDEDAEWREAARNQVEGGLTFDDLIEMWKAGVLPAVDTPQFKELVDEAISTTIATVDRYDPELGDLVEAIEDHKEVRKFWELVTQDGPERDGKSDWSKTVFETIRTREHLYEDGWEESCFRVQAGQFSYFPGLNDPWVMKAVAWLEGDDTVQPVNGRRTRHRDNGDWMIVLDTGRKNKKGKRITRTVWVKRKAFEPFAFKDFDTGEWDHIHLKRGRLAKPLKEAKLVVASTIKAGKHWEETPGYFLSLSETGRITSLGQIQHERRVEAEPRWLNRDFITDGFIDKLAEASEDETVEMELDDYLDEEVEVI